jgi:hypothetical protein
MAASAGTISSRVLPALALAGAVFFISVLLAPGVVDAAAPPAGLEFHVGGPRGWRVPDGNTSYGWWAMNNRFHVGDRLCGCHQPKNHLLLPFIIRSMQSICNHAGHV